MIPWLLVILGLIACTGFFVSAEFALTRARRARLEAMIRGGSSRARLALRATGNLKRVVSASQFGATLCTLAIGWIAAAAIVPRLADALDARLPAVAAYAIGAALALLVLAILHVTVAELTPRATALAYPERLAVWLAPPLLALAWLMTPLLALITRATELLVRPLGAPVQPGAEVPPTREPILALVEQGANGPLEAQDLALIEGVFEFTAKTAREVMTPRTDIIAIPVEATLDEVLSIVEEHGRSRYPVFEETIDDIVGIVLAKDLLSLVRHPPPDFSLRTIARTVRFIPGPRAVEEVLGDFKQLKEHMAIVLDEYGGTAGLVTMEDLLEEIVGEILDEYDEPDEAVQPSGRAGEVLVPGTTSIGEVNERFGLSVPEEDYTTIGGFVFGTLGRLPLVGDWVNAGGAVFTVREMEGRRIETLAVDLGRMDRRSTA